MEALGGENAFLRRRSGFSGAEVDLLPPWTLPLLSEAVRSISKQAKRRLALVSTAAAIAFWGVPDSSAPQRFPESSSLAASVASAARKEPGRLAAGPPQARTETASLSEAHAGVALTFEANAGQTDPEVRFLSRRPGYTLFLTPAEVVIAFTAQGDDSLLEGNNDVAWGRRRTARTDAQRAVLRMKLLGTDRLRFRATRIGTRPPAM